MSSSYLTTEPSLSSGELLPFHCPTCKNKKRFRSLIALRLHMSIVHDIQMPKRELSPPNKKNLLLSDEDTVLDNKHSASLYGALSHSSLDSNTKQVI